MLLKGKMKQIILNKYIVEIDIYNRNFDNFYQGCIYIIYNLEHEELFRGGCKATVSPDELMDKIKIKLWSLEYENL